MLSMSKLYVIVYWLEWIGINCVDDEVYTSLEDADKRIEELKQLPSYDNEKYRAITLSEYISEERKQGYADAKYPIE